MQDEQEQDEFAPAYLHDLTVRIGMLGCQYKGGASIMDKAKTRRHITEQWTRSPITAWTDLCVARACERSRIEIESPDSICSSIEALKVFWTGRERETKAMISTIFGECETVEAVLAEMRDTSAERLPESDQKRLALGIFTDFCYVPERAER